MPPRKVVKAPIVEVVATTVEPYNVSDDDNEPTVSKLTYNNISVKYNANDSDRVQLAQAINNLTVKGEQFVEALGSFGKFKQTIVELDIQIETKKKEYKELCEKKTREFSEKNIDLQKEYDEKTKQLKLNHSESVRTLHNELKNTQIETEQKLRQFKLKACDDIAKELSMKILKQDEYTLQVETIARVNRELEELKKKFESNCNVIRQEEKTKFETEIKRQYASQEQIYKTSTAEIKAQHTQQLKQIETLNETIQTLKHEIAEQRLLTKEIAQASAKSQISQSFGKN